MTDISDEYVLAVEIFQRTWFKLRGIGTTSGEDAAFKAGWDAGLFVDDLTSARDRVLLTREPREGG